MPWAAENYRIGGEFWGMRSNLVQWSFMAVQNDETLLFADFWFKEPQPYPIPYHDPVWNGLYNGWILILVLQILTIAFSIIYLLNLELLKPIRERQSIWLAILPAMTLLSACYQIYVQREVVNGDFFSWGLSGPSTGFWTATLSVGVFLLAMLTAQKQVSIRRAPQVLTKSLKKRLLPIALLLIVALFIVAELQYQSGVTKEMIVVDSIDFAEIYANPENWEKHFSRITLAADLFRARITYNSPQYAYCGLEVPIAAYRTLQVIFTLMGYEAREPTLVSPLTESCINPHSQSP